MKFILSLFLALFSFTAPLAAEEHVPVSPGPEVEGFLEALGKKDRAGAIAKAKGVFGLADYHEDRFVRTPGAFVDLVMGCPSHQIGARIGSIFKLYTYEWKCPSGVYQAQLGKDPESSYVEIVDPADEAHLAKRNAQKAAAPSMPMTLPSPAPLPSPEQRKAKAAKHLETLKVLEGQLLEGKLAEDDQVFIAKSNFATGYRDYAQSTFITEMDDNGLSAGNEQLTWLTTTLGKPKSASCEQKASKSVASDYVFYSYFCTVKSVRPGHGYTALVDFSGPKVRSIQFNYMNAKVFAKNRDYLTKKIRGN